MPQNQRKAANTKKLCDNCFFLLAGTVEIRKLQTAFGFKCENCDHRTAVGTVCEITVKKGAAAK